MNITSVDFHFDVMCPYAFQTSLWMRDVRDQLGLEVQWRFFSLEEIEPGRGQETPLGASMVLWVVDDASGSVTPADGPEIGRRLVSSGRDGPARRRPPTPSPRSG